MIVISLAQVMMESPGKILKKEREKRNISLEKIYWITKIKEHHLKAIEEDRYDHLPPPFYVRGYLKSYAKCLTLDEKKVLDLYENYLKSLLPPEPPISISEKSLPKKNLRSLGLSPLIIAISLLGSMFFAYHLYDPIEEIPSSSPLVSVSSANAIQREEESLTFNESAGRPIQASTIEEETQRAPALEILEAGIGTKIDKEKGRQVLIGKASEFHPNHQRGYFFTRIKSSETRRIAHVWLFEGKEYHRIEMEVKPPIWSVFSYLTFRPRHAGNWKAEARDGDQILASLNFKVLQ